MKSFERIATAALISLVVFLTTWWALSTSPYAIGIDGYYYAAQTRSYLEKGRFFASDASWVLYAMAWFSRLGPDIVVMNKVFVALCSVAFFWSASVLMRLFAVRPIADCLAAALLASSYLQFCRTNFIKNFVGLIFLTLLLRQILQPLQSSSNIILNKRWFLLTASVFLGSVVSHTQTAFVAIFILLVFSYFIVRGHVTTERQRILSIFTATVLSLVLLLLIYKNRARINAVTWGNLFVFDAVFPLQILKLNGNSHRLGVEAMALMALNMLFLTRYVWRALWLKTAPATDTLVVLLIVVTANPFYAAAEAQWGFRLHLISILPTALALVQLLQHRIPNLHHRWAFFSVYALSAGFITTSYFQLLHNMQINRIDYAEVQAAVHRLSLPDRHLLIAHQGFDYFYCYHRKGDAFHFLAEDKHLGREVFRVLYGFPSVTLRGIEFSNAPIALTKNYTLIKENDFMKVKAKLSPLETKLLLTFRNPTGERDLFLRQRDRERSQ